MLRSVSNTEDAMKFSHPFLFSRTINVSFSEYLIFGGLNKQTLTVLLPSYHVCTVSSP